MSYADNDPLESVTLEASRREIRELGDLLDSERTRRIELESRLASARSVLSDTEGRLREEITNAEQAEERVAQVTAHCNDAIEANKELMQRVLVLEGFIALCRNRFERHEGFTALDWEAERLLRGEKGKA